MLSIGTQVESGWTDARETSIAVGTFAPLAIAVHFAFVHVFADAIGPDVVSRVALAFVTVGSVDAFAFAADVGS